MVQGVWLIVQGAWPEFRVYDDSSGCMLIAQRVWFIVQGVWLIVQGVWSTVQGVWLAVQDVWSIEFRVWGSGGWVEGSEVRI